MVSSSSDDAVDIEQERLLADLEALGFPREWFPSDADHLDSEGNIRPVW